MKDPRTVATLAVAVFALSACEMPRFEGPQVQSPPTGFFIQDGTAAAHTLLPEMQPTFHTAWVHTDVSGVSTIYVDGYRGQAGLDDAMAAVEIMREEAEDPDTHFGGIEVLTIDGRQAWGWAERIESVQRGLVEVSYRAVIPYDTITFTVEFTSSEPSIKLASPDTLRATVASFAIGRTTWNIPLLAAGIGAFLLAFSFWREKRKARSAQLRTITLVQVEKPSGGDGVEADAAEGGEAAEASAPAAPPTATPVP